MVSQSRTVDVTIRIEKASAARLEEIVRALETSGLSNPDVHERFLVVNGSVAAERIDDLRKIKGVASVREDQSYKAQAPRG
jgi:hypothetical protein